MSTTDELQQLNLTLRREAELCEILMADRNIVELSVRRGATVADLQRAVECWCRDTRRAYHEERCTKLRFLVLGINDESTERHHLKAWVRELMEAQ
jgi:hypothetical protein